jgi:hypothetical protein
MNKLLMFIFVTILAFTTYSVHGATIKQTMEGSMDVTITHPDSVIAGEDLSLSFFVQNNGWEDKQEIRMQTSVQTAYLKSENSTLNIMRLSKGGSYGATIEFSSSADAQPGTYYLNVLYSHVLLSNNETPLSAFQKNIAIPITIKSQEEIQINTVTPSSIFPNAEFPFDVEIISKDINLEDLVVEIRTPADVTVRGQTMHTFSSLLKDTPLLIHSQIITDPTETTAEHKLPFEVVVKYTDDSGTEKTTTKTVSLLLRPRTFMEFTTDGGVWVGGVFLAPYVSIGTLVGIPAGALFSLVIRRLQKKKSPKKKKSK